MLYQTFTPIFWFESFGLFIQTIQSFALREHQEDVPLGRRSLRMPQQFSKGRLRGIVLG